MMIVGIISLPITIRIRRLVNRSDDDSDDDSGYYGNNDRANDKQRLSTKTIDI